ncbi:MAG: hypothetical protein BJBARM5_0517 [Candidatus Parvarchaeum acidophilus ARMAN-5]|jgi:hypothetical protein|uniref:Uncharacterized protein n=1 Tax=Candidatus Parvarchaeum acidophilus ARMAN-5 TaxID=662762 RepID=D6GVK4_PARA5|nr:MAG: hypothetical protein BJBARM5_0517 [Candidatus Parvarchaeum acidophilus ARMAN-5]
MLAFNTHRYTWIVKSLDLAEGFFKFRDCSLNSHENKDIERKIAMAGYCQNRRD